MKSFKFTYLTIAILLIGLFGAGNNFVMAQPDPTEIVNQFERTSGKYEGFRRSGAKGICAMGEFVGSVEGKNISISSAFSGHVIPVIVRFSIGGANPKAADNTKSQRNLALQFNLPDNEVWQMGNISAPMFGFATPEHLFGRLQSLQADPTTKTADPVKVKAFADANPAVLIQGKYFASRAVPASYVSTNYWGVHGFGFSNALNQKVWGKWIFEPIEGVQTLSDEEAKIKGPNFLIDDLRQRVVAGKASFNFNFEMAQTGDVLDNATIPLPEGRKKITLGVLKIISVSPDNTGPCLNMTFDPNNMPKGVEGAPDPTLRARTASYAIALGRRLTEGSRQ